jgi:glycosyltransferase involved in cell wall biosynthesis
MKVCIVSLNIVPFFVRTPESKFGGAETQAGFLARAFESAGATVGFVVANRQPCDALPYPSENAYFSREGWPGLRFLHPRLSGTLDALERADADVYYQRNAGAVTGTASWFCRRHGRVFVYGAGSDSDFSLRDVIIPSWRDRLMYMYGLRRADGVVVQNEQQAVACRAAIGREPRVIPNGITPSNGYAPGAEKGPVVAWVGALREVKQPAAFLELARRLPGIRFVMVGGPVDSDPGHAARVREDAKSISNLTLTGRVSQDEVARILSQASVLVNTSRYEGFPNAFLEAWAAGLPIVSLVDVDDVIAREQVGVVCNDVDSLARELSGLMDDPARRRQMGERARVLVERRYGADVLGPQYLAYFDELLSQRGRRGA